VKKSLLIIFLVLVTVPLCVVAWLGYSAYIREQETTQERYALLAREQLEEVDRLIESHLRDLESELREYLTVSDVDAMRARTRRTAIIRRMFVIDAEGDFVFPPASGEMSAGEREFLDRAEALELPALFGAGGSESSATGLGEGWYVWFMGDGLNFIFRQGTPDGSIRGIELERVAFVSQVIAVLPESNPFETDRFPSRIVLSDARGASIYQWGRFSPPADTQPLVEISLSPPLEAWHLAFYLSTESSEASSVAPEYLAVAAGILALIIVIAFLAAYFYREHTRVVREALEKVSFVNQVSHELKTPLTNIRLYAELLDARFEGVPDRESEREDARIIIAESSRLGRMINNVLSFAKSEKGTSTADAVEVRIDDIIGHIVEIFSPALSAQNIKLELDRAAPLVIVTDPDLVEQIVSNLVSNVEKYAAVGGHLRMETRQTGESTTIVVADHGPGIPVGERGRIFEAFYRVSNSLSDGVTGAGIGLTISRRLAILLGGTLTLVESECGAVFRLEIPNRPPEGHP